MHLVVTGSSSGIGRALTERLLARGHHVWGLARSNQSDFAAKHAGAFHAAHCDVSNWAEIARTAREIGAEWKTIHGLVACAGIHGEIGPGLGADAAKWSATVRVNLDGTFFAIRAFSDHLVAKGSARAKIVCFSGGGATKPRPNLSAYGVAKTGVVRLVETIAEETQSQPLDINALAPGAINTRLTDEILALGPGVVGAAEYAAALETKSAVVPSEASAKEGGSLAKALDCVEWLLSPASDGISGKLISAQWDPWQNLSAHRDALAASDLYTLRRIVPEDRNLKL